MISVLRKTKRFALQVYGPHVLLLPFLLLGQYASYWEEPFALSWLKALLFFGGLAATMCAWSASSVALGRPLIGFGWVKSLAKFLWSNLSRCWRFLFPSTTVRESDSRGCLAIAACVGGFLLLFCVLSSWLHQIERQIKRQCVTGYEIALFWLGFDLVLLTIALLWNGAFLFKVPKEQPLDSKICEHVESYEAGVRQLQGLSGLSAEEKETMIATLKMRLDEKLKHLTEENL